MTVDVSVEVRKFLKEKENRWKEGDILLCFSQDEDRTFRIYCMTGFYFLTLDEVFEYTTECFPELGYDLVEELAVKGYNVTVYHPEGYFEPRN